MLHSLQQTFKYSILQDVEDATSYIEDVGGVSVADRLSIYRNNTFVSLKSALLDTFPAIAEMVGLDFFRYMTHVYIQEKPPQNGALIFFGHDLSHFLKSFKAVGAYPYLADVAAFEWAMHESYMEKDSEPLSAHDFAGLSEADMKYLEINFTPSARVLKFEYPAVSLWEMAKGYKQSVDEVDLSKPEYVLIYRDENLDVQYQQLSKASYEFYSMIRASGSLLAAFEDAKEDEASQSQQDLALALKLGLFAKKEI